MAVLLVLAVGLLLASGGPLGAQESDTIEYPENGTDPVATFTATDPEGGTITWSLTGTDGVDDFTIDGGVLRFKESPDFESPPCGTGDDSASCMVTVNVSDGTNTDTEPVTIMITNLEEPGTVMLSTLQPQVEVAITATLNDPDGGGTTTSPTWTWYRGNDVIAGATGGTYTPMAGDVGSILKAKATYRDAEDADNDKTAEITSAHAVRAAPDTNNPPVYADQDLAQDGSQTAQTREVPENTPSGRNIGAPVVATDPGDVLTYSIDAAAELTFDIDRATGQLKTQEPLDREAGGGFTHQVTVTATDPFGFAATSVVTITVTNVDEAPSIATGATTAIISPEGTTTAPLTLATALASYVSHATEPEGQAMTWSLSGADADKFNIGNQAGGTVGDLTFKAQPDFESPGDANRNNVYEVTVVVSDPARNSDKLDVTVTVTNVAETGTITFSSLQPKVGIALTAMLDDDDGDITDLTWQWLNADANIDDATSATYTPVANDIGDQLTVTATYRDGSLAAGANAIMLTSNPADLAVVAADTDNKAPVFPDQDSEMDGRQTDQERTVAEGTASGMAIQAADLADFTPTDNTLASNGTPSVDTLTYTLGGTDTASFSINQATGQLSTKAELDYETKRSYTVTVTATDPGGLSATVNVTIKVTDVNEAPMIMLGGLVISGQSIVDDYAENGTADVATYTAAGPNAANARWSLSGDDAGDFHINTRGVLTFRASPNFEAPADADTDNVYMVTVEAADDGTYSDTHDVAVTVANEEEEGSVTFDTDPPVVGTAITATLTDPDRVVSGSKSWQWAIEQDNGDYSDITGANLANYTPGDDDAGKHLRVTVNYDDEEGANKISTAITDSLVVAGNPLLARYDADNSGEIDKAEMIAAINDYLFNGALDRADMIEVINLYLFGG